MYDIKAGRVFRGHPKGLALRLRKRDFVYRKVSVCLQKPFSGCANFNTRRSASYDQDARMKIRMTKVLRFWWMSNLSASKNTSGLVVIVAGSGINEGPDSRSQTVSSIAISGTLSAVARCMKRGTPRGGPPDEIVRHSSRKCSNSQHQWLCAKYSGSGTGSQAGTTDGRPAANQRSKNNYGPSSHRCAWCWVAVWSKRRRHRQSEPRSRAGGNSGRREQASRRGSLTAHRPRWAAGPRGGSASMRQGQSRCSALCFSSWTAPEDSMEPIRRLLR